jgi:parallel beta-helix repeat protein
MALLAIGCSATMSTASPGPAPSGPRPTCTGRALTPASNLQAAISDAPPGTTFCFGRGTYHVSALVPKSGDVLDGNGRVAVLDGGNSAFYAVYGDAAAPGPSDVTVRGFVIQNFRTPLQRGAIQDYNGPGWIIQDNFITRNAAAGVATGDNVRVLDNVISHNGQEGFSAHGKGGLYRGNDIAYNNFNLAVSMDWEAGGGKAWATDKLVFEHNYVHDNGGAGLWADTNNINTRFDHNTVSNNRGPGISEEISYNAIITNNTISRNATASAPGNSQDQGWGWDAGIQLRASGGLSTSSPLVISRNTVTGNFNGITLIQSPSPNACPNERNREGLYGACRVQNVIVEDNEITMSQGATGAMQDGTNNSIFTSWNIKWTNNHYCVASADHPDDGYMYGWFAWMNRNISWSEWQRYGLDKGGTFEVGGTCKGASSRLVKQRAADMATACTGHCGRALSCVRLCAVRVKILIAEPGAETSHCQTHTECDPHQDCRLGTFQLGIEERGHQGRRVHH